MCVGESVNGSLFVLIAYLLMFSSSISCIPLLRRSAHHRNVEVAVALQAAPGPAAVLGHRP